MADSTSARGGTAARRCAVCRHPLNAPAVGRKPRYCSNACRQIAYRQRTHDAKQRDLVALIQADARDWLPTLPDESVDLIVTDPPYHFNRGSTYFRDWFADLPDDQWPAIFTQLYRVLAPNSHAYVFSDWRVKPIFDHAAAHAGFTIHAPLVWDKQSIGLGTGCWRPQTEPINLYAKGTRSGNRNNLGNLLRAPRARRGYPTEKPVPILATIITQASNPGDYVLDPFCGSGNTGKAAQQNSRRALLCDINTAFAARRLRLADAA